jgi:hypothetical protein
MNKLLEKSPDLMIYSEYTEDEVVMSFYFDEMKQYNYIAREWFDVKVYDNHFYFKTSCRREYDYKPSHQRIIIGAYSEFLSKTIEKVFLDVI